jgi:succinyl-diaminopimelate desuccinylase
MPEIVEPVALTQALIRCASVTPADGGAQGVLAAALEGLGFRCTHLRFEAEGQAPVDNLFARLGEGSPNFGFAGHTDVVPVGDAEAWTKDPFAGALADGAIYGRGASDMKGAIAAFVGAVSRFLGARGDSFDGSISLLITGDEEGPAVNGTVKMLDWMTANGEQLDMCLVGEPTNPAVLGDMIKIGRRGSLSCTLSVDGTQGHVAYPHLADNPASRLVAVLAALEAEVLDEGNAHFQASNLEITDISIGNSATNVIPAHARARFNIRFNTEQTAAGLLERLRATIEQAGGEGLRYRLDDHVSGDAFLTPPGAFSETIATAVETVTGRRPELSTTGGTSDARFIKDHCPVAEFGLLGRTMHKVDEYVAVADLEALSAVYETILMRSFAS